MVPPDQCFDRVDHVVRDASLRLIEAYKAIQYKQDASELCAQMLERYAKDREVLDVCRGVPPPARADSTPTTAAKPPTF